MKAFIRETLRIALPSIRPPVLVASMGRSGSTLVYDSVVAGMAAAKFGSVGGRLHGIVRNSAWRLNDVNLKGGQVYKTHDFPAELPKTLNLRSVFLFGSASAAAKSVLNCETTYGKQWLDEHLMHLSALGALDELPDRDILRFEEQLDSWCVTEKIPVLSLKYEDLWTSGAQEILSQYLGFPVTFPIQHARASASREFGEIEKRIRDTYLALDNRISELPPILMNAAAKKIIGDFNHRVKDA